MWPINSTSVRREISGAIDPRAGGSKLYPVMPECAGCRSADGLSSCQSTPRKSSWEGSMQRVATGFGLIEGPVWDARGLYFSDVINGGVHLLDRAGKVSLVVPKRR